MKIYNYKRMGSTEEDAFTINSVEEFIIFKEAVANDQDYVTREQRVKNHNGFENKFAKLTTDLDMSEVCNSTNPFVPISKKMSCTFDGQDHSISNLYIEGANNGLFGSVKNTTIKNLTIKDSIVIGANSGGMFCINATNSNFFRCFSLNNDIRSTTSIGSAAGVGGICGLSFGGNRFEECINSSNISSTGSRIGGILGDNTSGMAICYIYRCVNTGNISTTNNFLGGIAGVFGVAEVKDSINFGQVNGLAAGGITVHSGNTHHCINAGFSSNNDMVPIGTYSFFDNQRFPSSANNGATTGSLTHINYYSGLLDTSIWSFMESMYPVPKSLKDHPVVILARTPFILDAGDNVNNVTKNISLPVIGGSGLIWRSENGLISSIGTITRQATDQDEVLIASMGDYEMRYNLTIKAI